MHDTLDGDGVGEVLRLGGHRIAVEGGAVVSSMGLRGPGIPVGFRLALRLHSASIRAVDRTVTPFLPIAALLGTRLGVPVELAGGVDATGLDGARRSVRFLHGAYGWPQVEVTATSRRARWLRGGRLGLADRQHHRGLFFSRGVDSLSTLVRHRGEISHLLGVDWVDPPFCSGDQQAIWAATQAAAAEYELPLLRLTTNARDVLDPLLSWNDTHGAVLCSLALLTGGTLSEAWISSAHCAGRAPRAHGNNKTLVESWSSSAVRIRQVAAADTRTEKAAIVATDDVAARWLKVCWEAPGEGNCGACEKCLLTMSNFAAVSALDRVETRFRAPLSAAAIRALDIGHLQPGSLLLVESALDELQPGPIRDAWRALLCGVDSDVPDVRVRSPRVVSGYDVG